MQKPGRNDPCPCGSGLKYKKCCLTRQATSPAAVADATWLRMRRTEGELEEILMQHMLEHYGQEAFAEAWDEFSGWDDVPMDADQYPEATNIFKSWLLYSYVPDNAEFEEEDWMPEMPIAEHYLGMQAAQVKSFTRRFIVAAMTQPFSYWQVLSCVPGVSITLRDLLRGGEVKVYERSASKDLKPGLVVFARVVSMDGDSIMLGMGSIAMPPSSAQDMLDYRQQLAQTGHPDLVKTNESANGAAPRLTDDILFEYDFELRSYYWEVRQATMNPKPPVLQNTDGEELIPTTLFYTLSCTPAEAFDALASLNLHEKAELLQQSTNDDSGSLVSIEFPWQKSGNAKNAGWNNTIMGEISINGEDLVVEVNSRERATSIKRRIAQRLRGRATLINEETEAAQDMIARKQADQHPQTLAQQDKVRKESEALMALPEVQEQMRRMSQEHWKNWLDTELPALRGQTPRQAATDPEGRERLQALLTDFEGKRTGNPLMDPDIDELKRQLGLT